MHPVFTPVDWSYNTNIYEVNLRQYTKEGTFKAFAAELPRLKDMGIEVLWFMPITPIAKEKRLGSLGSYYACSDYMATNPEFGTVDEFRQLVEAAHKLEMKVMIDWVANHTGYDHVWVKEHPEFYRLNHDGQFYDAHGWADVIDLNYDVQALQEKMISCMKYWVETCNIDGFRCDMAMLVPLHFWRKARVELDALKKLFWLAECEEIAYHEVFDATYAWKFLHKMEAYWRKETNMNGLEELLQQYNDQFPSTAFRAFFTSNHDENSHSGSEFERMGDAAKPFAVLCCTWNAVPLIYSGQELPNRKRLKFFDKDEIDWNGHYEFHDFYKKLLSLRKENPALRAGCDEVSTFRLRTEADSYIFAFLRKSGNDAVLVVLNLSDVDKPFFSIPDQLLTGTFQNYFSGAEKDFTTDKYFSLRPWEYQVYVSKSSVI